MYTRQRTVVKNGRKTSVAPTDDYVRESILSPHIALVEGYSYQMPSYRGVLEEKQLQALLKYLRSLN